MLPRVGTVPLVPLRRPSWGRSIPSVLPVGSGGMEVGRGPEEAAGAPALPIEGTDERAPLCLEDEVPAASSPPCYTPHPRLSVPP